MSSNKYNAFAVAIKIILVIILVLITLFFILELPDSKEVFLIVPIIFILAFRKTKLKQRKHLQRIDMFHKSLINNEGSNRTYNDIMSLIDLIEKYNFINIYPRIKLSGIDLKEKVNLEKKYSVEMKKFEDGYIYEIIIKEQ